ncbi:glycosyltransferase family 2 protein [Porphyromonas sp.]|uniref:glycosyltransferase family 2 protein n=1 Tax=Porphyromonas sp. TaxID=1924944 RepID=UPI0026DD8656|nr:glycosyltransferase family 2 protein [Porphyromonas sp.]MDO4771279.1 glycosyltransferase family 2 protein [Porphyromonas sp.]
MQGNKPTISVITVCYNAAEDLEKTIRSVLSQTYPHIHYIVIDGASKDATPEVLSRYREKIDVILSEPDRGIYDAMNKGIVLATGDYVCFMNAGDLFHRDNTLAEAFAQVGAPLPGVIYGDTDIVDADRRRLRRRRLSPPEVLTAGSFRRGMLVCHQSFYARRDLVPMYDFSYRFSADVDWCIKVLRRSSHNHNTHMVLTDYLSEGATTKNHRASLRERFAIMRKHYGLVSTLWWHFVFVWRALFLK